jgi:hypothetical protein
MTAAAAAAAAALHLLQLLLQEPVTHPWSWACCLSRQCAPWHLLLTCQLLRLQQHCQQPCQQWPAYHWRRYQQLLLLQVPLLLLLQGAGWLKPSPLLLLLHCQPLLAATAAAAAGWQVAEFSACWQAAWTWAWGAPLMLAWPAAAAAVAVAVAAAAAEEAALAAAAAAAAAWMQAEVCGACWWVA